ncbi:MAG: hypothetical protein ACYC3A_09105, partial [Halothiobacillus sp.]
LYMPAIVAKKHNPLIKAFCERLLNQGKRPMQVIVAAMRKLVHIIYGVLKSAQPFYSKKACFARVKTVSENCHKRIVCYCSGVKLGLWVWHSVCSSVT